MINVDIPKGFHPAIIAWFTKTFEAPTTIQQEAWDSIARGRNTLIAAPTGSGKTLAAFLAAIDDLVKKGLEGRLKDETQIVYVSPLKALSNDIEKNLQEPLKGIAEALEDQQLPPVNIRAAVRTGDTPATRRTAMLKLPPHILVTTPESLYLLLTSEGGRNLLRPVKTLIIDEIHAVVQDKRGCHLALTAERLEALTRRRLLRVGLSATQKPIEQVADFLTGNRKRKHSKCHIINSGHQRKMDLEMVVPDSPLSAVMANEVWEELYEKLIELIKTHQTTLIFVNTRRMSERLTHQLATRLGKDKVTSHHGSMAKEKRYDAEQRLKSGKLQAIVATASLELGIDIGSVDLVCQLGSPRTIATFLQRVGRSGHTIKGTPKGKLFPLSRDELVESAALFEAINKGELDTLIIPENPIDIMAQQIIAEVANREYAEKELFELIRRAYPFRSLGLDDFRETVQMLSEGYTTRRGRRGAYLHYDPINGQIRAGKGARLAALTSGGAIPDTFDYDVLLEPHNIKVGTVDEDFAIESLPGDIFKLGNQSWRVLRLENGSIRVNDAEGQPPTIPFWFGEAPGRSAELSHAVSRFRKEMAQRIDEANPSDNGIYRYEPVMQWLEDDLGIGKAAAEQLIQYLHSAKNALGVMPSQDTIVLERFFDEAGDMHLVVHSPFGSRLNRAWGLALRKRFCRQFNFELQASAMEDNIILSLGSTHSFPLEEVFGYLKEKTVREVLVQALLDAPMFEVRFRWNATRSLAILRSMKGKKVPAPIQRMNAEDLVSLVFPDQLACLENIVGEREVPDHPLVKQTIHDCLTEAMDIEALEALIRRIENKALNLITCDLREPSPLAHEIINARPYAFLDDGDLEGRRTRAIQTRRWLDPAEAGELANLDLEAIRNVKSEAWPSVENADELHDALILLGCLSAAEGRYGDGQNSWEPFFQTLIAAGRAAEIHLTDDRQLWIAAENIPLFRSNYPKHKITPRIELPPELQTFNGDASEALKEVVRGRLEGSGPVTEDSLVTLLELSQSAIQLALLALENEGFAFQGHYTPGSEEKEWCERRLLARIHRYTLKRLRKEIEPVSTADFSRFLFSWQGLDTDDQPRGPDALQQIVEQLEGFEAPAAAWEAAILPTRMESYDPVWLDNLCLSGRIVWGRFRLPKTGKNAPKRPGPIKTTPITLVSRSRIDWWQQLSSETHAELTFSPEARKAWEFLNDRGASFFDEILMGTQLLRSQLEAALSELTGYGKVTSDSFTGLRALLTPASTKSRRARVNQNIFGMEHAGRWSRLKPRLIDNSGNPPEEEDMARILLKRYGVVFRKLIDREEFAPPWRELVRVLRKMEARGEIRGGRFVLNTSGEQYALPEAVTRLRKVRKEPKNGRLTAISGADPLNLTGVLTEGRRISMLTQNRILYKDGVPVAALENGQPVYLVETDPATQWQWQNELIRHKVPMRLRGYLGKV